MATKLKRHHLSLIRASAFFCCDKYEPKRNNLQPQTSN